MIIGTGLDICDIRRIKMVLKKFPNRFKKRCFTSKEIKKCDHIFNSNECYAKRFAAKEAISKALGTGMNKGINWKSIEVENLQSGKPTINLYGKAKKTLDSLMPKNMVPKISITLTDEKYYAQALAIIEGIPQKNLK